MNKKMNWETLEKEMASFGFEPFVCEHEDDELSDGMFILIDGSEIECSSNYICVVIRHHCYFAPHIPTIENIKAHYRHITGKDLKLTLATVNSLEGEKAP